MRLLPWKVQRASEEEQARSYPNQSGKTSSGVAEREHTGSVSRVARQKRISKASSMEASAKSLAMVFPEGIEPPVPATIACREFPFGGNGALC